MKILIVPHPILLQKAEKVKLFDDRLKTLVNGMTETLLAHTDPIGVGISGNQVGALQRVFLIRPDEKSPEVIVCVNPEIVEEVEGSQAGSKKRKPTLEGCLSIPDVWGKVLRPERIKMYYQDIDGVAHTDWIDGFNAIVAQHEIDHLNGILFTQRVLEQGRELFREVDGELERWEL